MKNKKIYIRGMHCPSCEKLLEEEFKNILNVINADTSWKVGAAVIYFEEKEPDMKAIKEAAKKYGYEAFENELERNKSQEKNAIFWQDWFKAVLIVLAILFLYRIFQNSGLINAVDVKSATLSYGVSFLVGLVASVSSCLAVVGAVIIAFSEKYQSGENSFFEGAVKPNLYFHVGRLVTFFVLGGMLGAIGGELNLSGNFISIYTIVIAVIMGWLGLNILGIVPSLTAIGIKIPGKVSSRWGDLRRSEHKAAPFAIGGLSFFLPCGFTQSMQLFALASGSFLTGGIALFLFALGTVPTLFLLGVTTSWTKNKGFTIFKKVAGILIIIFAVYTLNSGLALKGVRTNVVSSKKIDTSPDTKSVSQQVPNQDASQEVQVVEMSVTSSGFEPNSFKIKQGVPVKWMINGVNVSGCTSTIIVPSYDISKNLKYGENIVEFTPLKKGDLNFSCGMGMVRGKFVVE